MIFQFTPKLEKCIEFFLDLLIAFSRTEIRERKNIGYLLAINSAKLWQTRANKGEGGKEEISRIFLHIFFLASFGFPGESTKKYAREKIFLLLLLFAELKIPIDGKSLILFAGKKEGEKILFHRRKGIQKRKGADTVCIIWKFFIRIRAHAFPNELYWSSFFSHLLNVKFRKLNALSLARREKIR